MSLFSFIIKICNIAIEIIKRNIETNKRKVVQSKCYKKDLNREKKRWTKRGTKLFLLQNIIAKLSSNKTLPQNYKDHLLTPKKMGYRECHVAPDLLLIYRIDKKNNVLYLEKLGTHSDFPQKQWMS